MKKEDTIAIDWSQKIIKEKRKLIYQIKHKGWFNSIGIKKEKTITKNR